MQKFPEVLSPVGSKEGLEAAVRSGADAVYLGAKNFSARRNAENFDIDELKEAVAYCHIRGVKAYLTLNIMIKDSELTDAFNLAKEAYCAGIDGIIISDLGLAKILKDKIPDLKLHGSTQMTVHSPSALPFLKELGLVRVVAAREMNKQGLLELCQAASELNMEVEVFVHGALCMCVSGQCLMSSVLGGRSGNRGLCAGPCRLPFKVAGGTGYDLSLKDLSLVDYIGELKKMGVTSLKIEGRMKRPEYVAAATASVKSAILNQSVPEELQSSLNNVFSRSGFTAGYYENKLGKDMFGIRTKDDVLSADSKTFGLIHNIYRNERQSVGININAEIKNGEPITLQLTDGENNLIIIGDKPQRAQNKPTTRDDIKKSLAKCGGTPYFAKEINIELDEGLFVSASMLNDMRRQILAELSERRKNSDRKCDSFYENSPSPIPCHKETKLIARFSSKNQIPENTNGLWGIMLPLESAIPESLPDKVLIADIPRWIQSEDILKSRLSHFKDSGFTHAYCGNLAAIKIAKDLGFKIIGGIGLNVGNRKTAQFLSDQGVDIITLSAEMQMGDAKNLNALAPKGIFAYGRLPLMLTKNCPLKNGRECKDCDKKGIITDRKNIDFPVECRGTSVEILNSAPLFLADKQGDLGVFDFLLLWFTDEEKSTAAKIIEQYKSGGKTPDNFTRGLYYRELL